MPFSGLVARLMPKMWFRMLLLRFTLRDLQPKEGNSATTADEAAKMWWNALSESDWVTVYKLDPSFEHSSNLAEMKLEYGGLQIMSKEVPLNQGDMQEYMFLTK